MCLVCLLVSSKLNSCFFLDRYVIIPFALVAYQLRKGGSAFYAKFTDHSVALHDLQEYVARYGRVSDSSVVACISFAVLWPLSVFSSFMLCVLILLLVACGISFLCNP